MSASAPTPAVSPSSGCWQRVRPWTRASLRGHVALHRTDLEIPAGGGSGSSSQRERQEHPDAVAHRSRSPAARPGQRGRRRHDRRRARDPPTHRPAPGELHLYGELLAGSTFASSRPQRRSLIGRAPSPRSWPPLDRRVREYSHGMKRQLLFAAAIAPDVRVRILDEIARASTRPSGARSDRRRRRPRHDDPPLPSPRGGGQVVSAARLPQRRPRRCGRKLEEVRRRAAVRLRFARAPCPPGGRGSRGAGVESAEEVGDRVNVMLAGDDPRDLRPPRRRHRPAGARQRRARQDLPG